MPTPIEVPKAELHTAMKYRVYWGEKVAAEAEDLHVAALVWAQKHTGWELRRKQWRKDGEAYEYVLIARKYNP